MLHDLTFGFKDVTIVLQLRTFMKIIINYFINLKNNILQTLQTLQGEQNYG